MAWRSAIDRAIEIRRRWAGRSAGVRRGLILSLRFKADVLARLGLFSEAREAVREAMVLMAGGTLAPPDAGPS